MKYKDLWECTSAIPRFHSRFSKLQCPTTPYFQKIDVFLKKMVKFFWGATSRKVLFQRSKVYFNSIWNCRFQIFSNKRQKFQKPKKKIILKSTYNEFWATLLEVIWNLLKSFEIYWNHLKSTEIQLKSNRNLLKSNWNRIEIYLKYWQW